MLGRITNLFPLWALLFSVLAYWQPALFVDLKTQIVPLLTIIMLAMGLTLGLALALTRKRPGAYTQTEGLSRAASFA